MGFDISALSFVLGAEIIEKHFTISNNFSKFRDHKISLNPNNFKKFVKQIIKLKKILGISNKFINKDEKKNLLTMRRKLVLKNSLEKGKIIKNNNLLIVRSPYEGILASEKNKFLGKKLEKKVIKFNNLLKEDFIK